MDEQGHSHVVDAKFEVISGPHKRLQGPRARRTSRGVPGWIWPLIASAVVAVTAADKAMDSKIRPDQYVTITRVRADGSKWVETLPKLFDREHPTARFASDDEKRAAAKAWDMLDDPRYNAAQKATLRALLESGQMRAAQTNQPPASP
jgi:hypothetical protein